MEFVVSFDDGAHRSGFQHFVLNDCATNVRFQFDHNLTFAKATNLAVAMGYLKDVVVLKSCVCNHHELTVRRIQRNRQGFVSDPQVLQEDFV